jgi:hypothetical protein
MPASVCKWELSCVTIPGARVCPSVPYTIKIEPAFAADKTWILKTSPTHNIGRVVTVGHVVLANRARRAILAGCGPRLRRVRSSRARAAGTDQPSRKGASRADHTGTESSSGIKSNTARRTVTRPLGCSQAVAAGLTAQSATRVGWKGVRACQAILARGSAGLSYPRRVRASLAGSAALGAIPETTPVGSSWTGIRACQDDHGSRAITPKGIQGCHLCRAQGLVVDPELVKSTLPTITHIVDRHDVCVNSIPAHSVLVRDTIQPENSCVAGDCQAKMSPDVCDLVFTVQNYLKYWNSWRVNKYLNT